MQNHNLSYEYDLSIIIPHHNSPQKLKRMLDSIPDNKAIQVIVVDDLSTSGLEEYAAVKNNYVNRVEFYDNTKDNKSAGGARNTGLKHAKGKWLLFGDADDFFSPFMWEAVKSHFDSDYDLIIFPPTSVKDDGTYELSTRMGKWTKILIDYYLKKNKNKDTRFEEARIRVSLRGPCSKLIRHSLVMENNIHFECVKVANDTFFSAQVGVHANKFFVDGRNIYVISESEESLTGKMNAETRRYKKEANKRAYEYALKNAKPEVKKVLAHPFRYMDWYSRLRYIYHLGDWI